MPRKTQFTSDEIVEAAMELVRQHGRAGLTAAAVAKAMGSSTMPIYSHFKNLDELEEEIVRRAWSLIKQSEARVYTGDVWIDQAIGYVFFARNEKNLFRFINDGKNLELLRKMLDEHMEYLTGMLESYTDFEEIDETTLRMIRFFRATLTHGLASIVNIGWNPEIVNDEKITFFIRTASKAIKDGVKNAPD